MKWGLGIFPFQRFYFYILGNVLGSWLKGLKFQRVFLDGVGRVWLFLCGEGPNLIIFI